MMEAHDLQRASANVESTHLQYATRSPSENASLSQPGDVESTDTVPPPQDAQSSQPKAPSRDVPAQVAVSIEHPCIIRNFDNAYKSLGGEAQIKHILEHRVGDSKLSRKEQLPEPVVGVSLRPRDPFAQKIASFGIETRNVLVKVTVPKRTGRKRKRGSDDSFEECPSAKKPISSITAPELLQRLQENADMYAVEPVAMLNETHRFRTLPDFQLRKSDLPIMQELRQHAMKPEYNILKQFNLDMTPGSSHITAFPGPPSFTSIDMPHKYDYQQASGVVFVTDANGQVRSTNLSAPQKRASWGLPPDVDEVPQAPPENIRKRSPTGEALLRAIGMLDKLMVDRPIVTKRVALNALPPMSENIFREATQHVGYGFRSGPFRDTLIKYGVDPRRDPKYRYYQTFSFQIDKEAFKAAQGTNSVKWARSLRYKPGEPESHIFDGKSVSANGKTWQVRDINEPNLQNLFSTDEIRARCDVYQWGWYFNGTMSKARVIMKDMIRALFAGEKLPLESYAPILGFPNKVLKYSVQEIGVPNSHGTKAQDLAREMRSICRSGSGMRAAKTRLGGTNSTPGEWADDDDLAMGGENDALPEGEAESGQVGDVDLGDGDDLAGDFDDHPSEGEGDMVLGAEADEDEDGQQQASPNTAEATDVTIRKDEAGNDEVDQRVSSSNTAEIVGDKTREEA